MDDSKREYHQLARNLLAKLAKIFPFVQYSLFYQNDLALSTNLNYLYLSYLSWATYVTFVWTELTAI